MALKRITLAFISIILTMLLPASLMLHSIENTMLKPQFWEMELEKMHAYDSLKEELAARMAGGVEILPDAWLKEQAHALIENLLGYIRGEKPSLNLTISTKGLKEAGKQELYRQAEAEVERQIDALNYKPEYREQAKAQLLKEAEARIDEKVNALPESADLAEGRDNRAFDQTRAYVKEGLAITRALQATSILLLLFGLALAGNLRGAAKWLAPILILTGASLLLLEALVPLTLEKALAQTNSPGLAKQLVADLFSGVLAKTTPQGIGLTAAGVLLFFLGQAGKQEDTKPEEKKKPEEKTSRKKAK